MLLPLLSIFVISLNTAIHILAEGSVKHHAIPIRGIPTQSAQGAVFPHASPGLMLILGP